MNLIGEANVRNILKEADPAEKVKMRALSSGDKVSYS